MVKKEYELLKKKYALPNFDVLDKEFEISAIEIDGGFLLREIKSKIKDKLMHSCDILTKMIQPETTALADLYEYRCFDEAAKRKIFDIFSHVMYLIRRIHETELILEATDDAKVIKEIAETWPKLRKQMIPFVKELEVCWEKTPESDKELKEYLG